ncbi:hypothetical protein BJV82DRAFT_590230 [Fennellomyces sp. T-0311]|nr:hypothetical protein BJV82DRAFT_590230 [Fennellomyces sp. T-0311]
MYMVLPVAVIQPGVVQITASIDPLEGMASRAFYVLNLPHFYSYVHGFGCSIYLEKWSVTVPLTGSISMKEIPSSFRASMLGLCPR